MISYYVIQLVHWFFRMWYFAEIFLNHLSQTTCDNIGIATKIVNFETENWSKFGQSFLATISHPSTLTNIKQQVFCLVFSSPVRRPCELLPSLGVHHRPSS